MKSAIVAATLGTVLCLAPASAGAATGLASIPLKGTDLVCSCTNLTAATIVVNFSLVAPNAFENCSRVILGGSVGVCAAVTTTFPTACKVFRSDGKTASEKDLACSLSALDAAGETTAVVPVSSKLKP